MSTLYLVATPIGNMEDMSARASRILDEVVLIAAEDTRQTRKLIEHFNIHTPLISYHEHNKERQLDRLLTALEEGDVALVSDAGTPVLNDPGYELVCAAIDSGHLISPIPGPSAPIAALVASGLPADAFLYLGYLPRKRGERRRLLQEIAALPYTLIFLETPHRLLGALEDLGEELGDRQVAVAREMTKLHEEIFRGKISEARDHFSAKGPRGEFTLVLAGSSVGSVAWSQERIRDAITRALEYGGAPGEIARRIAGESGWSRRELYDLVMEIKKEMSTDELR